MESDTAEEIKRHFDATAHGLRTEIRALAEGLGGVRTELAEGLRDVRSEIRAAETGLRSEIQDVKRHSDVVAESLRSEIRLVAEGVAGLDDKFAQEFVQVREEIGDVKSLVRVSYANLDRRLSPS